MTLSEKRHKRTLMRHRLRSLFSVPNLLALVVLALAVLVAWRLQRAGLDLSDPQVLKHYVHSLGLWGPIVYIGLLTLTVVVSQLPGVPLAVAAGLVWGSLLGGVYTVAGGFLGSLIAYYLGRTLGRSAMRSLTGKVRDFLTGKRRGSPRLDRFCLTALAGRAVRCGELRVRRNRAEPAPLRRCNAPGHDPIGFLAYLLRSRDGAEPGTRARFVRCRCAEPVGSCPAHSL